MDILLSMLYDHFTILCLKYWEIAMITFELICFNIIYYLTLYWMAELSMK